MTSADDVSAKDKRRALYRVGGRWMDAQFRVPIFLKRAWTATVDEIDDIVKERDGCIRADNSYNGHYAASLRERKDEIALEKRRFTAYIDAALCYFYSREAIRKVNDMTDQLHQLDRSAASPSAKESLKLALRSFIYHEMKEMKRYEQAYMECRDLAILLHPYVNKIYTGTKESNNMIVLWPNIAPPSVPAPSAIPTGPSSLAILKDLRMVKTTPQTTTPSEPPQYPTPLKMSGMRIVLTESDNE